MHNYTFKCGRTIVQNGKKKIQRYRKMLRSKLTYTSTIRLLCFQRFFFRTQAFRKNFKFKLMWLPTHCRLLMTFSLNCALIHWFYHLICNWKSLSISLSPSKHIRCVCFCLFSVTYVDSLNATICQLSQILIKFRI